MFERYNEKTRRVIFFARYEASEWGSPTIETEHLLLGLLRETPEIVGGFLADADSTERVGLDIRDRLTAKDKIATSIDLPLSNECKAILAHTAEEAERLGHRYFDTIHLLLGILREEGCMAAKILAAHGLELSDVREKVGRGSVPVETSAPGHIARGVQGPDYVPDADTAIRIAEAVWLAMGFDDLEQQRPVRAELTHSDYWAISSTAPEGSKGRLFAVISKRDGRILKAARAEA